MTKTQLREQARQRHEQAQREKQYAIIMVENERGWGFVRDVVPQTIIDLVPVINLHSYSCLAYAIDRASADEWAARIAKQQQVQVTVIPVEERWDALRYSRNLVVMAQRYAPAHLVQQIQERNTQRLLVAA